TKAGNSGNVFNDWNLSISFGSSNAVLLIPEVNIIEVAQALYSNTEFDKIYLPSNKIILEEIDNELLSAILKNPNILSNFHPKSFEDLVSYIWKNQGFDIERVGNWNQADGGVDIFAVHKSLDMGEIKFAIQCKHSKNNIGVSVLRELSGVLDRHK